MLRIITILTLLFAAFTLRSESISPATTNLYYEPEDSGASDDDKDRPGHRHRMPPAPIFCSIDFDSQSIVGTSSLLDSIVEYRLLDIDGTNLLLCDSDEQSFVAELSQLTTGHYILLFVADGYQLSGAINL